MRLNLFTGRTDEDVLFRARPFCQTADTDSRHFLLDTQEPLLHHGLLGKKRLHQETPWSRSYCETTLLLFTAALNNLIMLQVFNLKDGRFTHTHHTPGGKFTQNSLRGLIGECFYSDGFTEIKKASKR